MRSIIVCEGRLPTCILRGIKCTELCCAYYDKQLATENNSQKTNAVYSFVVDRIHPFNILLPSFCSPFF